MNGSRNLACEHIRTALGFEHAGVAVALSGAIADRAVLRDALARRGESAAIFSQLLTSGTDIEVAFGIECEVAARESSVRALGFVNQVHVRLDPALVHQPTDHIGRAVASIRDQARRSEVELFSRSVEHGFGRANFRLADGCRRLDIHNHCMLQVDEIVVGVGITGDRVGRSGVAGRRSVGEITFGSTGVAPLKAASSRTDRYSATARLEVGTRSSTLATLRRRCASATIMLASTAKASPPTIRSLMQRATTVSNSLRRRSLSRKRPWRFLEKVE